MITHVAIIRGGTTYSLRAPNRHHDVLFTTLCLFDTSREEGDVQGFVDDTGRFLTREEAYVIAKESGQLNRRPDGYDGPKLFSEDLW